MQSDSPFTSVIGLGALNTEFRTARRQKYVGLIFGLICLAAGPILALFAAWLGWDTYNQRGSLAVTEVVIVPLCVAAGAFGLGALIVFNSWRNWTLAAALYENG